MCCKNIQQATLELQLQNSLINYNAALPCKCRTKTKLMKKYLFH